MTVIVAGAFRIPTEHLETLRPHMLEVMAATRAEDGCTEYTYAESIDDPGLIRVFEAWRDQAALKAHFTAPHMAAWQAARAGFGMSDRRIFAYDVASERQL